MNRNARLLAFTAPFVLGSLLLVGLPAVVTATLAFCSYDALSPPRWVGLANFVELRREPEFWHAVHNSVFFLALAVPLRLLAALGLALLLHRPRPAVGFCRAAVFLPTVVPEAAYALIWLWVFNPLYGPLAAALRAVGVASPSWFTEPGLAKLPFVALSLFQIGEGLVVLLAGLRAIPAEYREAAVEAGASSGQVLRHLILPLLAPWLVLLAVRDVIFSFPYTFTLSLLMTGGDPYYATLFMPLLTYEEAFDRFQFGIGAAHTLITLAFTAVLVGALLGQLHRRGFLDEA